MPHINDVLELLKESKELIEDTKRYYPADMEIMRACILLDAINQLLHEFEILKTGHLART